MSGFYKRFVFFIFGLALGILIVNFFFNKKKVEFDYLPNARTLKSIRNKPYLHFSPEALAFMQQHQIDTTQVMSLLHKGDVNFKKSVLRSKPCQTYMIEPTSKTAAIFLKIERCDSIATVISITK